MIVCTAGYVGKVSKMLVIFTVHSLVMLIIVVNAGRVANIGNVGCAGGLSNTDTQSWARTVFSLDASTSPSQSFFFQLFTVAFSPCCKASLLLPVILHHFPIRVRNFFTVSIFFRWHICIEE